jgi:Cu2+-exporting ATPase
LTHSKTYTYYLCCIIKNLDLNDQKIKNVFAVTGMMCASCAISVESMIASLPGVSEAAVNYAGENVYVTYDPETVAPGDFAKAVEAIGYGLIIEEDDLNEKLADIEQKHFQLLKRKMIVAVVFSVPVFVLSMFHLIHIGYKNWILLALSLPVIIYPGSEFYLNAWKQARHRMVNMDTLVALSTGIAFIFSAVNTILPAIFLHAGLEPHVYYESATVIITFILAGKFLEERSKSRASAVIKNLMSLQPKTLTVSRDGKELEMPLAMVAPGDKVMVRPGDHIPVDGIIETGDSYIDESMISGEPLPVFKSSGFEVYTGTLNTNGNLVITASKTGKNTLLAGIIAMVQEAQSGKPPIQKLADKIASVFVPIVLALAAVTFVIWWVFGPQPSVTFAFLTTISVLIIACPCALGLATPTALMVGIGRGAAQGILIRNAENLETACKIDTVIFDKTGTLTTGKPKVTRSDWYHDDALLKQVLFSIEKRSGHPLAYAIAALFENQELLPLENFSDVPGKGVRAAYNNDLYIIGNKAFMDESGIKTQSGFDFENSVFFARNTEIVASFSIEDSLRETTVEAIGKLKTEGINVYLLTGDRDEAASAMAEKAGITNYFAGVLPSDKNLFVKELRQKGYKVAMVGDGINDSAAMAEADLGIAMATGSDIALDSAGIILMQSDLRAVAQSIQLSKATVRTIRQNFFWAFFYNIIAIPIAAGALFPLTGFLLSPMIAGAAMAMSSVTVVMNSLRLKRINLDN